MGSTVQCRLTLNRIGNFFCLENLFTETIEAFLSNLAIIVLGRNCTKLVLLVLIRRPRWQLSQDIRQFHKNSKNKNMHIWC